MNRKKRAKIQQNVRIAKTVLKGIGLAALVGGILIFPGITPMIRWIEETARENPKAGHLAFRRMQKRGLIQLRGQGRQIKIVLLPKGKKQLRRYQIADLKIPKPQIWDGKWRLVMFDIPESNRTARDLIRQRLRYLGLVTIQKSVFIHPYPCYEVIGTLRDHYGLPAGQLYVFEAKVLEGEEALRRHFRL